MNARRPFKLTIKLLSGYDSRLQILYSSILLVIFMLLFAGRPLKAQNWNQLGSTLYGSDTARFGFSVAVNGNGTMVALATDSPVFKSKIVVYKLNDNEWQQFGNVMPCSCEIVKISDDGSTVIAGNCNDKDLSGATFSGSATVFGWNGTRWIQKGPKLYGAQIGLYGFSVGINEDGSSIAVYSRYDLNRVRVYTWNPADSVWNQKGNAVSMGNSTSSVSVGSMDFSSDGNTFIVGNPVTENGKVGVFTWNGNDWEQKGDLFAGVGEEHIGPSVSINRGGNTIMISSPLDDDDGTNTGEVTIYQWDGTSWIQKGQSFHGTFITNGDCCYGDFATGMDDSGNLIAFNIRVNEMPPWKVLRIYAWNGLEWAQKGLDIEGGTGDNLKGDFLSFNGEGNTITVGIPYDFSYEDGHDKGRVRTYKWKSGLSTEEPTSIDGDHYFTYAANSCLNFSKEVSLVSLAESSGRLIRHFNPNGRTMEISTLPPGVYLLLMMTDGGIVQKKIIRE